MLRKYQGKDNALLVEFEMMFDFDFALYKLIKRDYLDDPKVNKEFFRLITTDKDARIAMIARTTQNPLAILTPNCDYDALLKGFMNSYEASLLEFVTPYSIFGLMRTLQKEASSVVIDVLCRNELEAKFIHDNAPDLRAIISSKQDVNPINYSAIYIKYITSFREYKEMKRRYIYVAKAGFNADPNQQCLNMELVFEIAKENAVKSIDLYIDAKYYHLKEPNKKEESSDAKDLL